GYSLDANDYVVVQTPLIAGDTIVVQYQFNQILEDVYNQYFGSGQQFLFNTNILLRLPFVIYPVVAGSVVVLPSYSVSTVEANLISYVTTALSPTTFITSILPATFQQNVQA